MKKILAAIMACTFAAGVSGCSIVAGLVGGGQEQTPQTEQTMEPAYTLEPVPGDSTDVPAGEENTTGEAEPASQVNLRAVENFAGIWNMTFDGMPDLQLAPSEAAVTAGDGMLLGGQVFECSFRPGQLYLYLLEGQLIGARLETHTNSWGDNDESEQWGTMWKTMIESVNGNWAAERYQEIITQVSSGMPPAGQEDGTRVGPLVHNEGWVYQMIDEDLGYEYVKTVSAWLSAFAGAAGRPVELEQAEAGAGEQAAE